MRSRINTLFAHFNPRSLTGATRQCYNKSVKRMHFNPRSLTGATFFVFVGSSVVNVFQSTLPHGSDTNTSYNRLNKSRFQSTLPHGSDRTARPVSSTNAKHFNPRSLTGATSCRQNIICPGKSISIHAPSRERH